MALPKKTYVDYNIYIVSETIADYTLTVNGNLTLSGRRRIVTHNIYYGNSAEKGTVTVTTSLPSNMTEQNTISGDYVSGTTISFSGSSKTLRLVDLPTEALSNMQKGTVYIDNGFLKIVQ